MNKVLILVGLFFCATLSAQDFPSQVWHDGHIVLIEGDTLTGQIRYNQETDVVEYMMPDMKTAIALTGQKILYAQIFDNITRQYRDFFALPYALNGDYETPILFEVLIEGKPLTLLSRERLEFRVVNSPYAGASYSRMEIVFTYFFLRENGEIEPFNGNKKQLLWLMRDKSSEVKKFIKSNRLRTERRSDLIKLVYYYNNLFSPTHTSADNG